MKIIYDNFHSAFAFEEGFKNKLFKLVMILVIGPPFFGLYLIMGILLILNKWVNKVMKLSVDVLIHFYTEYETTKKLVYLLFFGTILLPFIFALYISVIIIRIAFNVFGLLYNIFFVIETIPNKEIIKNKMEYFIKENQEADVF